LTGAYRINPYNPEETADVIFQALEDPPGEKSARMAAMRSWVQEHNIFQWSARFLQALIEISQGD
jgi:trehalose-6-phosphate synthase